MAKRIPRDEGQTSQLRPHHQQAIERVTVMDGQARTRFHMGAVDAEHLVVVGNNAVEAGRNDELAD